MNPQYIRQIIMRHVRQDRMTLEDAARTLLRGMGGSQQVKNVIRDVIVDIRQELTRNAPLGNGTLTRPGQDAEQWYTGVEDGDRFWPGYRDALSGGSMASVVPDIDRTSHQIVSRLANPRTPGSKRKGLVLGYVQSGKTANYTAVMSKAADAGYQLVIVLAGMHNNLRRQTQVRLEKDLLGHDWHTLTTPGADFGHTASGSALLTHGVHIAAVVKKQRQRLGSLRDWLRAIPLDLRMGCPVLLLDDEADQATPNTKAESEELSKINELIREIWQEIPTGTYVGYTATPFANVFMDPTDEQELYPSDFIMSLPKPDAYFGAVELFGSSATNEQGESDDGMDVIRFVPDEDSELLRPPYKREERENFHASIPGSLEDAIVWFIVATAIRRARGQADQHSSMLVHTTHYTGPHFSMRDEIGLLLESLTQRVNVGDLEQFEKAWQDEHSRAAEVATEEMPPWHVIGPRILEVLSFCRVVVDNSESEDRLDYERKDDEGVPIVETVIAVGGGTLSRGLTLEGLVVSYFLRTSSNYDTLLQMARWFGYRPGYEDLPRIWMPVELRDDFEFLGLIETELRQEIAQLIDMGLTPGELGVRVRAHPGRLAITARNKLVHAETASLSYTGQRLQTFILDKNARTIADNQQAAINLIDSVKTKAATTSGAAVFLAKDVSAHLIADFFRDYEVPRNQHNMHGDHIVQWLETVAAETQWNVAVMGRQGDANSEDLGDLDLGLPQPVPAINRAPLITSQPDQANIKALLSQSDWVADIPSQLVPPSSELDAGGYRELRREHAAGNGLLTVHVVSGRSVPMRRPRPGALPTREPMNVDGQIIAIGVVFPGQEQVAEERDGNYYVVRTDWDVPDGDPEEFPADNEESEDDDFAWLTT